MTVESTKRHNPGVEIRSLVERVWPGRRVSVEELAGGITNHNFKVLVDGGAFVLRIGGKDTELLGIDRRAEQAAARMAAAIGVGPEVLTVVEPEGYLVTRFITGNPVPPERMRDPETVERVAASLRAIHGAEAIPSRFNAHRVVEAYAATATARGVTIPADYQWAKDVSDRIDMARGPQPEVTCHNDLLNANFIDDGRRIRIVDWEYAGMGDRFFDLGNLSIKHDFGPDDDRRLLEAYSGEVQDRALASVRVMRFMGAFFEAMWGVVQQGISELDFDFKAYADENFDRLRRIAADPHFEGWIAASAP
jgi:thiamine kinase-like enzyme